MHARLYSRVGRPTSAVAMEISELRSIDTTAPATLQVEFGNQVYIGKQNWKRHNSKWPAAYIVQEGSKS